MDFDDFIQRDREAEIAKIRSRRAERDQMNRVFRRRRAIADSGDLTSAESGRLAELLGDGKSSTGRSP